MPLPKVIELLGPPAAGKSSVVAALTDRPDVAVLKDHEAADLPWLAWAVVRHARQALSTPLPDGVRRTRWLAWTGRLAAAPQVVRRRRVPGLAAVLVDQGPAYSLGRMLSMRERAVSSRWWTARLADCAHTLDVIAVLDADPATLLHRLRERPKSHAARSLSDQQALTLLAQERYVCQVLADALEEHGVTVLRLDTGQAPVGAQVAAVAELLGLPAAERGQG